ncbi:interleukin-23 subunit alpha [Onychostruthus taczanowskii]|uniref:interleukin-23 subunit alpha n=1 Tax=Onychostruthus taczanowskii TaxID=356909 RepID=UPI001B80CCB7|nr:interleukin-23 subunit alpha [Onychostruthus taczanowskii]
MAPLRRLRLCLLLALLPPPPAAPAPAPAPAPGPLRPPDWAACKVLSRELSRLLAAVREPHPVLEGLQLLEDEPQNWPPRIRCSDACDPPSLESNHTRCLQRVRQALQHYRDLLGSDIFREQPQPQLQSAVERLLRHVPDGHGRAPRPLLAPTLLWEQPVHRHRALNRLRSFAALIGRVFNHSAR